MAKPIALYDACVLYPAPLRDLLMHLALTGLFRARWTDRIHDQWIRAVCDAVRRHRQSLRRPPMEIDEFLTTLRHQRLPKTVAKLQQLIDFL